MLDRIWADWRSAYVSNPDTGREDLACVMCNLVAATDDAEALVLERTPTTITVMNLYPYGSGHLMVAPVRHVASYEDLSDDENGDVAAAQLRALRAIRSAYQPDGINVGANLGRAAGAGIPGHLHVHVLPRWTGDTNFMTAVAEVRVLPESLRTGYDKLKAAWPQQLAPVADEEAARHEGDALPEDLDVTAYVGPYEFPDIKRRRIAGACYIVIGLIALWGAIATGNRGLWFAAILLGLIAAYHFLAGWPLKIDQTDALAVASRTVGFPVGHASAQLAWRGFRSRPTWRILVYSADEPPSMRGLVELDGVDGHVLGEYTEHNPEDWSHL